MRSSDWQVDLVEYLINGGTVGRSQAELIKRASNRVNASDVIKYLYALQSERKIQSFAVAPKQWNYKPNYRTIIYDPKIVWRATIDILPAAQRD